MEKHYSKELKNKVINAYKSRKYDFGYRQVSKKYKIKENNWVLKQKEFKEINCCLWRNKAK